MTRIPTVGGTTGRAPGRVGVPQVRSVTLAQPAIIPVADKAVQLAVTLQRAQRTRQMTAFKATLIEKIGLAEDAASEVDPIESESVFQEALSGIEEQIGAFDDEQVQSEARGLLAVETARSAIRVRRSAVRREGEAGRATVDRLEDVALLEVAKGKLSAADAADSIGFEIQAHTGTAYTKDTAKDRLDAFESKAIRTEYHKLLGMNISEAAKKNNVNALLDSAVGILPADEIARKRKTLDVVQAQRETQQIATINDRAVSFSMGNNVAGLEDLLDTLGALDPNSPAVQTAKINVEQRLRAERTIKNRADALLVNLSEGKTGNQASDATMNSATQMVQDTTGDTDAFMRQTLHDGLGISPMLEKNIKDNANPDTLDLEKYLGQLDVVGDFDIPQAERLARASSQVGETAYFSTRRLVDENAIRERRDVLSDPNAPAIVASATEFLKENPEALTDGITRKNKPASLFQALSMLPLPSPKSNLKVPPQQNSEIGELYKYHVARLRIRRGLTDPDQINEMAQAAAVNEFNNSHVPMALPGRGQYLFPKEALDLGSFTSDIAAQAIVREASAMLRDAGTQSDLLVSRPIIDQQRNRSYTPIATPAGITGYVMWDGEAGIASRVTQATNPEVFKQLQAGSLQRPPAERMPNQDLVRQGPKQTMSTQIGDGLFGQATNIFQAVNNNRLPDPNNPLDRATMEGILSELFRRGNWTEP